MKSDSKEIRSAWLETGKATATNQRKIQATCANEEKQLELIESRQSVLSPVPLKG